MTGTTYGIVAGYDGSPGAAQALRWAAREAWARNVVHLSYGQGQHGGWGFGMAVRTYRGDYAPIGQFGWDGGLGTSWRSDPREDLVAVLMTQRAWTSPRPPDVCRDFWTSIYQALDD